MSYDTLEFLAITRRVNFSFLLVTSKLFCYLSQEVIFVWCFEYKIYGFHFFFWFFVLLRPGEFVALKTSAITEGARGKTRYVSLKV